MAESWRVVEHSWARTSIYCGKALICSLSIEETATEENQEDLELEMAKHARLIAAAPEMLEALMEILEVAKASLQYADSIPDEDRATINKAKTAIAKAEGVKP